MTDKKNAEVLGALGNPMRLEMVKRLSLDETFAGQSISELAKGTGLTRQAITKHLETLADAGLVIRRNPGRATWYELNTEPLSRALKAIETIVEQRARSLQRLKTHKETLNRLSSAISSPASRR